jgi:bacterioferritin-associated ferredoxin
MFVCICRGITESAIRRAGEAGVVEPQALVAKFQLDDDSLCGQCREDIGEFVSLAELGLSSTHERTLVLSAV